MAAMSLEATLECTPLAPRTVKSEVAKHVDWTPGQWSGEDTEDSQEDEGDREEAESLIATGNEAMASLSEKNKGWQIIMDWAMKFFKCDIAKNRAIGLVKEALAGTLAVLYPVMFQLENFKLRPPLIYLISVPRIRTQWHQ